MRWRREAPAANSRYVTQGRHLAPCLAQVVADEEFRGLGAAEEARTAFDFDRLQAVDVVLSEAVVAGLPRRAAVEAHAQGAIAVRAREYGARLRLNHNGADVLVR